MASVMVRVSEETRDRLREIATREGMTLQAVVELALEDHERQRFWEEMDASWAALRTDSSAWQAELDERAAWAKTSMDGLDEGETWSEAGEPNTVGKTNG